MICDTHGDDGLTTTERQHVTYPQRWVQGTTDPSHHTDGYTWPIIVLCGDPLTWEGDDS